MRTRQTNIQQGGIGGGVKFFVSALILVGVSSSLPSSSEAFLHNINPTKRMLRPLLSSTSKLIKHDITKRTVASSKLFSTAPDYDVIIVGGGHAGCDAASASSRTGARTALITQRIDTIGELSCNPSIGGIGKGHLVREIDALGGVMGEVADAAGIHFRMLNRRKGPAVRGPRGQMDRDLYKAAMQKQMLELHENLDVVEGGVEDLLLEEGAGIESMAPLAVDPSSNFAFGSNTSKDQQRMAELASSKANSHYRKARICGVVITDPKTNQRREITARAVVITTGTFLRGVLMIGKDRYSGGRHLRDSEKVEPPSVGLAKTLEKFQFPLGRLKTGTPPRLDGNTIDWDACTIQPSENPAIPFSHLRQFRGEQPPLVQANTLIDCYKSATNEETHKLVSKYAHLLPEYDGNEGKGQGPRYCPSIFKKVERFPERTSHNSFLEPEGLNTNIVYPNGMSGPYPEEIQLKIMRTMIGLENVDIIRPGYDVEYDFVNPQSLTHALETKTIAGLYLAGQICGTTGYEEAAAQGIIAGTNAGLAAGAASRGDASAPSPFLIGRDEGYIGVLIDDLVTRGTTEPYRMFTSRAEYRISLRADNADLRLTQKAIDCGLVKDEERIASLEAREMMIEDRIEELRKVRLFVTDWADRGGKELMGGAQMSKKSGQKKSAEEVLGMPHVTLSAVERIIREVQLEERNKALKEKKEENEESSMIPEEEEEDYNIPNVMDPSPPSIYDTVEASVKYKSYVIRQHKDMESWRRAQGLRIPPDFIYDHASLPTLSKEEIEKLNLVRPATFADASQISGLTPQSLVYLYHCVLKRNKDRDYQRRKGSSEGKKVGAVSVMEE